MSGCTAKVWARTATPEQVDALLLEKARLQSRVATLTRGLAVVARKHPDTPTHDMVKRIIKRADESSMGARLSDLQFAHVNTTPPATTGDPHPMTDTKLREAARAVLEWHDGLGGTRTDDRIEALRAALDEPPEESVLRCEGCGATGDDLEMAADGQMGHIIRGSVPDLCGPVTAAPEQAPEPTEGDRARATALLDALAYDHANHPDNLEESIRTIHEHDATARAQGYAAGVEGERAAAVFTLRWLGSAGPHNTNHPVAKETWNSFADRLEAGEHVEMAAHLPRCQYCGGPATGRRCPKPSANTNICAAGVEGRKGAK